MSKLSLIVVLCCGFAWIGCNRLPPGPRHMEAGKRLFKAKDYDRAILEFKNAVAALPNDADAYYQLGLAYEATGKGEFAQQAFDSMRKAAQLNPKHTAARLEMARLESRTTNKTVLEDAEAKLRKLQEEVGSNVESLSVLAVTQFKLDKRQDAADTLVQALGKAPGNLRAAALLATVKMGQNDGKGAEEVVRKALEQNPNSADAMILVASVYQAERKFPDALVQLQRAVERSPKNIQAWALLGDVQGAMNRTEDAAATYKHLSGLGDSNTRHLYAVFLFSQGKRAEAVREFERLFKENSNDRDARTRLVAAYYSAGRKDEARKLIENALSKNRKDTDALLQRSEFLAADGKYNDAELDLSEVLRLHPESTEAHYILATVRRARGEDLSYRQELFEVLKLRPSALGVRLEAAQSLLAADDPKGAIRVLDEAGVSQRSDPALLVQRNWALWRLGDFAEMRKGIDIAFAQQKSAAVFIQDGYWKIHNKDFAGAVNSLEEALKSTPDSVLAMEGLRQAHIAQKQGGVALAKVKVYAARQPKSASVQQYYASVLLENGDRTQARAALNAAHAADPNSVAVDLNLVQLDISEQKFDDAASKLQQVIVTDPRNSVAYLWLGNLQATRGEGRLAAQTYRKAADMNPNNPQALNNLAYSITEYENNPEAALKLAQQAKQIAPNDPDYADTLGWVLYRKGVYQSAVEQLESAVAQNQGKGIYRYHLAMAYLKAGRKNQAKTALDLALKQAPNLPEAKTAQALFASTK